MELRLDHLLSLLRHQPEAVLRAIDQDPLLLKKESSGLVLANASQRLYTPQAEHQLFAKGIVYRREPYRLVSLPLIKIYNVGEREVTVAQLTDLAAQDGAQLRFLRKVDGSLVQVFRADGRAWFTTRGMIEGARQRPEASEEDDNSFDYLAATRRLAAERYPALLTSPDLLDGRTLIFELIHPGVRKVTQYGERADLILLAAFDQHRLAYLTYPDLQALGTAHGLQTVDALSPRGMTLAEQIDDLLKSLAGTDQEGSVVNFERGSEVIYRVKVKSPDYLHLMRVMAECTYDRTVTLLEANPQLVSWQQLEAFLKDQGRDKVPEEIIEYYKPYFQRYRTYLEECERLLQWAQRVHQDLEAVLGSRQNKDQAGYRKSFAALAGRYPFANLIFAALDGRLDLDRVRKTTRNPEEASQALAEVAAFDPGRLG